MSNNVYRSGRVNLFTSMSKEENVIIIDPESEYIELSKILGGIPITITPSNNYINPFEITNDMMEFQKTLVVAINWWGNKLKEIYENIDNEKVEKFKILLYGKIYEEAGNYSIVKSPYLFCLASGVCPQKELAEILEYLDLDASVFSEENIMYIYQESIILNFKFLYSTEEELNKHIHSYKYDIKELNEEILSEEKSENTYLGRLSNENFIIMKNDSINKYNEKISFLNQRIEDAYCYAKTNNLQITEK